MKNDEIIKVLRNSLSIKDAPNISQEQLNEIIDICITDNWLEGAWRLALTYGNYNYDFTKIFDFYIEKLDSYYLMELVYVLGDEKSNLKKIYNKVKDTQDKKFISDFQEDLMDYFVINDVKELEKIIDTY